MRERVRIACMWGGGAVEFLEEVEEEVEEEVVEEEEEEEGVEEEEEGVEDCCGTEKETPEAAVEGEGTFCCGETKASERQATRVMASMEERSKRFCSG